MTTTNLSKPGAETYLEASEWVLTNSIQCVNCKGDQNNANLFHIHMHKTVVNKHPTQNNV